MLKGFKDKAVAVTLKTYFNNSDLQEYGKMLKLEIDSANKTAKMEVHLKGENEPLNVTIGNYSATSNGDDGIFLLKDVNTSKEWMKSVIKNIFKGEISHPVPASIVKLISTEM